MLLDNGASLFPTNKLHQINLTLTFLLDEKPVFVKLAHILKSSEAFDNVNILKFIANRKDAITEREELVDLLDFLVRREDGENSQNKDNEMVKLSLSQKHLKTLIKSNLKTSIGLVAFLESVDTRYPISSLRKWCMIGLNIIQWIIGVGFYILDVGTDIIFALRIQDDTTSFIIILGNTHL